MNYNSRRDKNVKGSDVYAIAELERHSCAIRVSWASTHEANFFAESFMQRDVGRHNTCHSWRVPQVSPFLGRSNLSALGMLDKAVTGRIMRNRIAAWRSAKVHASTPCKSTSDTSVRRASAILAFI